MTGTRAESTFAILHELAIPGALAALFSIPLLLVTNRADIASLYMGIACAWFATEVFRLGGLPSHAASWRSKMFAVAIGVSLICALFVACGWAANVQTHMPFPVMAILCTTPSFGLVPWLVMRTNKRHEALVLAAFVVGSAKIAGCVVARIVYGPDFIAEGYVAGDWRTAKVMISCMWAFTIAISFALFLADYRRFARRAVVEESTMA
jgi:purine-cytosine permease-like protein